MAGWCSVLTFRKLNNQTIKDTYLLPHIDETLDSLQGSQWFSSLDLKLGYWQVKIDEESKPLTAFTVGPFGLLWVQKDAFQTHHCPLYFPEADGDLSWGPQSPLVHHLLRWHRHLLQGSSQPPWEARGCAPETGGGWTQAQAFQVWAIPMADWLLRACDLCPRSSHWRGQNWSYQEVANTQKHHRGPKFLEIHGILPLVYP